MGTVKKISKSSLVEKTEEKKTEAGTVVKHQKKIQDSLVATEKNKKESVSKRDPVIKERRQYISDLLKKGMTYEKTVELTNAKYDKLWQIETGYVSGVLWDTNRGNLGLIKPAKPIERMVEVDGKIIPYSVKKAEHKTARKAKKDDPLLQKYAVGTKTESKTETKPGAGDDTVKKPIKRIKK